MLDLCYYTLDKTCFVMQQSWQHALLMKKGSFLSHVDLKCLKQL